MKPQVESSNEPGKRVANQQRKLPRWKWWLYRAAGPVFKLLVTSMWRFNRWEFRENDSFRALVAGNHPVVFAIWHEGILTVGRLMARLLDAGYNVTFLISPSADGEIGVQLLASFGSKAVRGSARRSGAAALRGLKQAIVQNGQSPCIAIDGSKGPRRHGKPGALMVARMSGVPIVPIGFAAASAWRLPTWDRHVLPKPFSRVVISAGEPYTVPRKMDEAELEVHRSDLESRLNLLMHQSEESLGLPASASAAHPPGE